MQKFNNLVSDDKIWEKGVWQKQRDRKNIPEMGERKNEMLNI